MESLLTQVEEWLITLIDRRIDGRIEETVTDLIDEKLEESSFQDDFDISEYTSEIEGVAEMVARNIVSELDISEYHEEIESLIDDRIFSTSFSISVTK